MNLYFQTNSRKRDRINISEKGEILKTESKTAESLNSFISNIVKNLNISRYSEFNPVTENIADPTVKAIFKYKDHPSIIAIQRNCGKETFCLYSKHKKRTYSNQIKIKRPGIQTFLLKLSKITRTFLPTFYVQTLTVFSNHLCLRLV